MTNASMMTRRIEEVRTESWWFVWLAMAFLFGGFASVVVPMLGKAPTALAIGCALVFIGVVQLLHTTQVRRWGGAIWQAIMGIVILAGGIALLTPSVIAAVGYTLLLGIVLIVIGVIQFFLGLNYRPNGGSVWITLSGIVAVIFGALIIINWPGFLYSWETSSEWAASPFAGVSLMATGWAYLMMAQAAQRRMDEE